MSDTMIPNSETKQIIMNLWLLKNANSQCKRIIRPPRARSAPLEEWIQDTINIESHDHDDVWIGKAMPRDLKKSGHVKCFN